jgi:hypothetical protein
MEIASPLNGGSGFAGKSGRKTANVRDANPMETTIVFFAITVIKGSPRDSRLVETLRRLKGILAF